MSTAGSVTHWIGEIKAGDAAAAQKLWEAYFQKLVRLARTRLGKPARRAADEEQVALDAILSFWEGAARGRFPHVNDRTDLWRLLVHITACKAINQINREKRCPKVEDIEDGIAVVVDPEPTPAFAAQVAEEYERLLSSLDNAERRKIAVWKLEGYSNEEIAAKLGCVVRSVERKLQLIRTRWGKARSGHERQSRRPRQQQ